MFEALMARKLSLPEGDKLYPTLPGRQLQNRGWDIVKITFYHIFANFTRPLLSRAVRFSLPHP